MRSLVFGLILIACNSMAIAQEQIALERAQKAAKILTEQLAKESGLQLAVDADADKPFGLKKGELAAMAIPDRKLTVDRIEKPGKDIVPVGQLWLKGLTTHIEGNATPADKLRIIKVSADGVDHELPALLLGVRAGKDGKPELVVYAKGKDPLVVLPLEGSSRSQEQPIELEGQGEGGDTGKLILHFFGKFYAKLPIAKG